MVLIFTPLSVPPGSPPSRRLANQRLNSDVSRMVYMRELYSFEYNIASSRAR
jgi:hypothetical protein